jgi:hypothetical protein
VKNNFLRFAYSLGIIVLQVAEHNLKELLFLCGISRVFEEYQNTLVIERGKVQFSKAIFLCKTALPPEYHE